MRLVNTLIALVAVAGCSFGLPDIEQPVATCPITGESDCGTCLRTKCQAEINYCCGDASCRGGDSESNTVLAAFDTCAAGDSTRCAESLRTSYSSFQGDVLKSCLASRCQATCAGTAAVAPTAQKWSCSSTGTVHACSMCIYKKCSSALTKCCGEGASGSCASTIEAEMSACIRADFGGCSRMLDGSEDGTAGALRGCVIDSCPDACFNTGRRHQRCTLRGGGDYCTCNNAEVSGGDECTTESVNGSDGSCFFNEKGCTCGHYACDTDGDTTFPGCHCDLINGNASGKARECNANYIGLGGYKHDQAAVCCLDVSTLTCSCKTSRTQCPDSEYSVFSCDPSQFDSAMVNLATESCTF
jgi:hypothetical protein